MARKYSRDNRGRFSGGGGGGGGGGATARGGRLATASGNKRKTQTMKAAGGQPKNTVAKRQKVVPTTAKDRAGVAEVKRRKAGKLNAEDRMMDKAMKAAYPGVPAPGGRTMAANKVATSPRKLSSNEQKVAKIMGDKSLRSDRQRLAAAAKAGVKGDFGATYAKVKQKLGNPGSKTTDVSTARKQMSSALKKVAPKPKPARTAKPPWQGRLYVS